MHGTGQTSCAVFFADAGPGVASNGVGTCFEADAGIDTVNAPDRHTGVVPSVTDL